MLTAGRTVDVISLCSADGELRPLRIRIEEDSGEMIRGSVKEILSVKENHHIGAESRIFLCRADLEGRSVLLELKYHIRSLSWFVMRMI